MTELRFTRSRGADGGQPVVRILGVSGSLRETSNNASILRRAAQLVPEGVELTIFDGLRKVEPFDEDIEGGPHPGADAWRAALREHDAVLVATPEYNSSIPGQLKNALDWASRAEEGDHSSLQDNAVYGQPFAVVSSSSGQFGGVWAAQELRKSLKAAGARVVEEPVVAVGHAHTAIDEDDTFAPELEVRLVELMQSLAEQVARLRAAGIVRGTANTSASAPATRTA